MTTTESADQRLAALESPAGLPLPPVADWVRVSDVVTVLLALIAFHTAVHGRIFISWPLPVSIGSPWRPLLVVAFITAVRHALVPRPSVLARFRGAWIALFRSTSLRAALAPFLLSRCAILLVAVMALGSVGYPAGFTSPGSFGEEMRQLPSRWDGGWYSIIGRHGYQWNRDVQTPSSLAFFPAYPILIRVVGRFLDLDSATSGFAIASIAFLWALAYLFRLARERAAPDEASAVLLFLAFYPFAVFYSAAYAEALLLLAFVGSFYHFRRSEWLPAAGWALLAGLTRPNGFLLCLPLAISGLEEVWKRRGTGWRETAEWRRAVRALAVSAMPVAGMLVYSAFVHSLTDDFLTWWRLQGAWGRLYQSPLALLIDRYHAVAQAGLYGYLRNSANEVLNSLAAIGALAAIWPVSRRLGLAYGAFVLVNLVPNLLFGGTITIGRTTATLFPVFLWLGLAIPAGRRVGWVAVFGAVQAFVAVLFYTARPMI